MLWITVIRFWNGNWEFKGKVKLFHVGVRASLVVDNIAT